jgi:hypothetical protein
LINRNRDNWRPLIAIADPCGGDWPRLARDAAQRLTHKGEQELGIELLQDMRDLFARKDTADLLSDEIVTELGKMEHRQWPDYRNGKALAPRDIAKLLKPFKISPKQLKYKGRPHGYELKQFNSAFERYLTTLRRA